MTGVDFAPLEGITDDIYRRTHAQCFSGVDRYYIPFISPTQDMRLSPREARAVDAANQAGLHAVPQILSCKADQFLWAAREMADRGYREVNLNIGCPSGTVTAKGKGAGALRDTLTLGLFLDEIFARSPLPVSIKTRIGYDDPGQWEGIMETLRDYPASEIIIHIRTRADFYSRVTHPEAFRLACEVLPQPLTYNGDVFTAEDVRALEEKYPRLRGVMPARGIIADPALAREIRGGEKLRVEELRTFYALLRDRYLSAYPGRDMALNRLRECMLYTVTCFEDSERIGRTMCKARRLEEFEAALERLFTEHRLIGHFVPFGK